jgi:hypothetical protein
MKYSEFYCSQIFTVGEEYYHTMDDIHYRKCKVISTLNDRRDAIFQCCFQTTEYFTSTLGDPDNFEQSKYGEWCVDLYPKIIYKPFFYNLMQYEDMENAQLPTKCWAYDRSAYTWSYVTVQQKKSDGIEFIREGDEFPKMITKPQNTRTRTKTLEFARDIKWSMVHYKDRANKYVKDVLEGKVIVVQFDNAIRVYV